MASTTASKDQKALDHFIMLPVSADMVSYLADQASAVIRCESRRPVTNKKLPPTPPATPPQDYDAPPASPAQPCLPSLETFIQNLVDKSRVQVPTLMSSLVYLSRLQQRLPPVAKGMRCTVHRIFLASLILAAKNLNDSSPKNKHWARYSCVKGYDGFGFSLTEVNLMEKQLLFLLDWDLRITTEDLLHHFEPFLTPIRQRQQQAELTRLRHARENEVLRQQRAYYSAPLAHHQRQASRPYASTASLAALPTPPSSTSSLAGPYSSSPASYTSTYLNDLERFTSTPADLPQRSTRPNMRHPRSVSPPSAADVPALSRPGTSTDSYSVSSRSASVSPMTSQGTPASSMADDSYVPVIGKDDGVYTASVAAKGSASVTYLGSGSTATGDSMYRPRPTRNPREISHSGCEEKPAKKMRTVGGPFMGGGGIISRFLNGTSGANRVRV